MAQITAQRLLDVVRARPPKQFEVFRLADECLDERGEVRLDAAPTEESQNLALAEIQASVRHTTRVLDRLRALRPVPR